MFLLTTGRYPTVTGRYGAGNLSYSYEWEANSITPKTTPWLWTYQNWTTIKETTRRRQEY